MYQNIFPSYSKEEVIERVSRQWDLSGKFPLPRFKVHCPSCHTDDVQGRQWNFHSRGRTKYRCDVSFKCTVCSMVWVYGVVIPNEMYIDKPQTWEWRQVKQHLDKKERS